MMLKHGLSLPLSIVIISGVLAARQSLTEARSQDFRFLSAEQAMADQAYFAENVVFSGLEQYDLTASNTPWFAIGGS